MMLKRHLDEQEKKLQQSLCDLIKKEKEIGTSSSDR
jgi:hypothetical protein